MHIIRASETGEGSIPGIEEVSTVEILPLFDDLQKACWVPEAARLDILLLQLRVIPHSAHIAYQI